MMHSRYRGVANGSDQTQTYHGPIIAVLIVAGIVARF